MSGTKHKHFHVTDLKLANDHHVLEVEVYYSEGGVNWFTGDRDLRGVCLSVFPMEKSTSNGFSTRSFMIGGGKQAYKGKIEEAGRYNAKRLEAIANDLKAYGVDSIQFGAEYKRLRDAVLDANNFKLATTEEEVFKPHVFEVGERFSLVQTDRQGQENWKCDGVVTGTDAEGRYSAIMDDDTTRSYLKPCDHSTTMVSLGHKISPEAMAGRRKTIEDVHAATEAKREALERENTERYERASRGIKADFPDAILTGSRHARASANCKRELQRAFPGISFSCTAHTFSGGETMDVRWTDGPKADKVEAIIGKYQNYDYMDQSDYVHVKRTPEHKAVTDWLGSCRYVNAYREYSQKALDTVRAEAFKRYGEYSDYDFQFGAVSVCSRSDIYGDFVAFFDLGKEVSAIFAPATVTATAIESETDEAVTVRENESLGGIEVIFREKPEPDVRARLKQHGFRWSTRQGLWFTKANETRRTFANSLVGGAV